MRGGIHGEEGRKEQRRDREGRKEVPTTRRCDNKPVSDGEELGEGFLILNVADEPSEAQQTMNE